MAKLQTIRCNYCRKLLWSSRWSAKRRMEYEQVPHTCAGLAASRRSRLFGVVMSRLAVAQQQLEQALVAVKQLEADTPVPAQAKRSKKKR